MAGLSADKGPLFKVILLGEAGVGKTSIFHRLKDDIFQSNRRNTMGIDSCSKYVKVGDTQVTVSALFSGILRLQKHQQLYLGHVQLSL